VLAVAAVALTATTASTPTPTKANHPLCGLICLRGAT
jgi:hypothetical protein